MKKLFLSFLLVFSSVLFADDRAYYEQFLYREDNTSDDPDFPQISFRYLMNDYNFVIDIEDGKKLRPSTSLLLFKDGSYHLRYQEMQILPNGSFFPGACKTQDGQWDVREGRLVLDQDFASGIRHFAHNQNQVMMTFHQAISHQAFKGKPNSFSLGFSNHDPRTTPCIGFPF